MINPTPYAEINALLSELLTGVQTILGNHLVGIYLEGSLANGDFDESSDVDFVVVSDMVIGQEHTPELFAALYTLHEQIAAGASPWAIQLEGSYLSQHALRRYDPADALHPNLERGQGERLKMVLHNESWATHRHILRNHGITLVGPPPSTLLDPVTPADLRLGMQVILPRWLVPLLGNPAQMASPGYQSYVVLSLCRILYTLHHGAVVSKRVAAQWAIATVAKPWAALIEQASQTRHTGEWATPTDPMPEILAFMGYVLNDTGCP
ncbi:MAG: DUF4111 domain-containing protein [Chloroflexi bacterium]|nr:DUF4111 domain-containing protein [Chloroflexota bacterium]